MKQLRRLVRDLIHPKKKFEPGVYIPNDLPGMSFQNSIYIPTYHTDEYKEELLRDSGVVGATSCFAVYGKNQPLSDSITIIRSFEQGALLPLLSRLANHIAHKGTRSAKEDKVQKDLLASAILYGRTLGREPTKEFENEHFQNIFLVSPDLINGLIAMSLVESSIDGSGKDPNKEIGKFSYLLLCLNDHVFDDSASETPDKQHLRLLRQNLVQAPFLGTLGTFSARIFRFYTVFGETLGRLSPELRRTTDRYLEQRAGVTFETLIRLLFPINVPWISAKDFRKNVIIDDNFYKNNSAGKDIKLLLSKLSLPFLEYGNRIKAIRDKTGDTYFKSSKTVSLFSQYPFLEIHKDTFLLLAPHLILRAIELSIRGAFIDAKHKPIEAIYGPLGEEFEKYGNQLLARKLPVSTGSISTGLVLNPKDSKQEEICDALIEAPEGFVAIESKYKPPPISALDISIPDTTEIENWVRYSFTIPPDEAKKKKRRPGALWQLREAAIKLNNKERGYIPASIVPVILLSEEILFTNSLYFILDKEIREQKIFSDISNIKPLLVVSIGELEMLSSLDLNNTNWSLFKLFFEKSTKSNARQTSWSKFTQVLNLKYLRPTDERNAFEVLFEAAKTYFTPPQADLTDPPPEKA